MKAWFDTLATDFPRGHRIGLHAHDAAQLVFARSGVMRVVTEGGIWVVPPDRALWMPARQPHAIHCTTALAMRSVYIRADADPVRRSDCVVVAVTPLMREIVVRLVEGPVAPDQAERLVVLLLDELRVQPAAPLHLPEPEDSRLRVITAALSADPADRRTLDQWARMAGLGRRTLARRFRMETGMTFGSWRRQLRFLTALERLGQGAPVTDVALDAGYESVSAFIHAFRRTLGVTPRRYFSRRAG
jgi:AraC-like DNA-binding protein